MTRKTKWILATTGVVILGGAIASIYAARAAKAKFEPYLKEQAIAYLSKRFDADVQLDELHVQLPPLSRVEILLRKGRGMIAEVTGRGVVLRRKQYPDEPPVLAMKSFTFQVDLGSIFDVPKEIPLITVDGLELHVPPRQERPAVASPAVAKGSPSSGGSQSAVAIDDVRITNTLLVIHPSNPAKEPLRFDIQELHLTTNGPGEPMGYQASLINPKPKGQIESTGKFGPWDSQDPGSSALEGIYSFSHADLGVFNAIAGTLESTGTFTGVLSNVQAKGEARVPNFQLKTSGNPVPLKTQFEAEIDGTNGNTTLKPIHAQLGNSQFVTSGAVIRYKGDTRKTIDFSAKMSRAQIEDFLRLAMKGPAFMKGTLQLDAKIKIPPLAGKVVEKLQLNGTFDVSDGLFLKSAIQDKLDELSRKSQGEPKNQEIDEVLSHMSGAFIMSDQSVDFSRLAFGVPGADIDLTGGYDLAQEAVDFHGTLRMIAKVSQTQTGVKRWLLKPADPFFSKDGAGTLLRIKIDGSRSNPSFGLDHKKRDSPTPASELPNNRSSGRKSPGQSTTASK